MKIYIYSDESGVFDRNHEKFFIFAGLLFLNNETKENATRKYIHAEREVVKKERLLSGVEPKASNLSNAGKAHLYRSLNAYHKFGVVVRMKHILEEIWASKKSRQRYMDYAFKIGVKRKFEQLIRTGVINPGEVSELKFFVDEHSTATDGRYELKESLLEEFKEGIINPNWNKYFPPIFKNLTTLRLQYCDSRTTTLIRSADIIANRLYHTTIEGKASLDSDLFIVTRLP